MPRSAREEHTAFSTAHPAVPAAYLAVTLGLTMGSMQPVPICISLAAALLYNGCARGPRAAGGALRWQLPFVAILARVNPLFSASGSTELFRFGVRAVYLESLCYGLAMGGLFIACASWFSAASRMLPFDKVMALAGNAAPLIALMVSMTMRLIPRFVRRGRRIAAVQAANAPRAGAADAVRERLRLTSVLMGWGMEDSLETADAMRARGWGAARRTTYVRYRFCARDAAWLCALAALGAVCVAVAVAATSQFAFYPTVTRLIAWWGYLPYAAWMLLPTVLHLREGRLYR